MKKQPCPLAGLGAIMSWNGFVSACLARQAKEESFDPCPKCKIGKKIKAGKKTSPPKGIKIIIPTDWTPGPVIYPKESQTWASVGRKPTWPFTTMEIAEVFEGNSADKKRIWGAMYQAARKHGKKFENWIMGDKIFVERVR